MGETVGVTLTKFLLARLDEDEAVARNGRWATTGHVDRRVLAECEAKRRIVEWATDGAHSRDLPFDERYVLAALALPYADHPDYDEEWKP